MKEKLKYYYFYMNQNFPFIGVFLKRFIKYKKLINSYRKKINGHGNVVKFKNIILLDVTFDIEGSNNYIEIRDGSVLRHTVFFIRGNNHNIIIENDCIFSQGGVIWMEQDNGYLSIGHNTTMENVHIAVTENNSSVLIGKDCMFAYDIEIRTGDSHSILDLESRKRINKAKNIVIGNHVWLAAHCRILKGVNILDNCVIGSDSVVTKSCEHPNVILAGNPAKIIKTNIIWDRRNLS